MDILKPLIAGLPGMHCCACNTLKQRVYKQLMPAQMQQH
jgi:hypothetical protein